MNRTLVSSSNIRSIGYDSQEFVLEIEFHKSGTYQYSGVPITEYKALMAAVSHGSYFTEHVKDVYPVRSNMNKLNEQVGQLSKMRMVVDYYTYDMSVSELLSRLEKGSIDVAPIFQRKFQWKNEQKSLFIESIFLGIPIPSIFTARNNKGQWEVVDGAQRLSTIAQFAGSSELKKRMNLEEIGELKLKGLTKIDTFNGSIFTDLPESVQLQFLDATLKVLNLNDKSNYDVRFDLFERLNTGGITLTSQEIRDSVYRGEFIDFVHELSTNKEFREVIKFSSRDQKNGTPEEYIIRFFALYYDKDNYTSKLKSFLNNYARKANQGGFNYDEAKLVFEETFSRLSAALPDGIVRGAKKNETPPALFEAVSVGTANAILEKPSIKLKRLQSIIESQEISEFLGEGSNAKLKMESRINLVKKILLEK